MSTFGKIMSGIGAVCLFFGGTWCLMNPGKTFVALALILGIALLVSGVCRIVGYIASKDKKAAGAGFLLADGIITTILGILIVAKPGIEVSLILIVFSMWLIFGGISRIMLAATVRGPLWGLWLAIGVIITLAGIYTMFDPLTSVFAVSMIIGIYMLAGGVNMLTSVFVPKE